MRNKSVEHINNELNRDLNIKVSIVSYTNSLVYVHGIEQKLDQSKFTFKKEDPRSCFESFNKKEADIALVPLASFLKAKNFKIIEPYCIAANKTIRTVSLLSNSALEDIKKVYLDSHSLTSINLFKILSKKYFKKDFDFIHCKKDFDFNAIAKEEAVVAIGDKVFDLESNFSLNIDLAEAWHKYTGKPFTFAVFIAREDLKPEIIDEFTSALKYGVNSVNKIASSLTKDKAEYITNLVKYELNDDLKSSINNYLSELKELDD